ncbi:hypothetical protein B0H17DRAFT_1212139 [Mycena rosella]|uniref:FAD-binding domain-containing protein n=1 Tax=Mycena rosella TaxID=1033263 RepID=A0AAD7G6K0_MYCRO|nr:hypothetical protein B0H17DRAFT_1212139 [Mycena rosella]
MTDSEAALTFIIVGASVAGLASAIALKASGHNALILEKESHLGGTDPGGCARVPPNGCKVLFDWGLEAQMRAKAAVNVATSVYKYDGATTSERDLFGINRWNPEFLSEARGEFLQFRHQDLLRILYDQATKPSQDGSIAQVTVLFGAEIVNVDCKNYSVTLLSGHIHTGDAIIGADGASGVVRRKLLEEERVDPDNCDVPTGMAIYGTIIPRALVVQDPDLASFYEYSTTLQLGSNRGAVTTSMGTEGDIMFWVYTPVIGQDDTRTQELDMKMTAVLGPCDPQLRKLAELAPPASCVEIQDHYELESWVSQSGRVLVLGDAAHPFVPASMHTNSIAIEDGAFIGKIFSHTRNPDRIPEFFHAFEEHRRDRCHRIQDIQKQYITFITLPDGEMQIERDATLRANAAAGLNVMGPNPDSEENNWQMITETRMIFSYDPADDADEWWMSWGRFREFADQANA